MHTYILITLAVCVHQSWQQQHGPPGGEPPKIVYPDGHEPLEFKMKPHDQEHIKEHLNEIVDKPKEEMSEEELEFHYFKLHDYDNNNKLDGTEIVKAITHFHQDEEEGDTKEAHHQEQAKVFSDAEIANIVDMVIKEDDLNNDGYIEYPEFVTAQRKAKGGE